ncbi:MAG: BON domain-containing protein [Xanthomonadales bacterium]|nr:BON domain-containing protein [Xanthomonadales bacterium]
MNQIKRFTQRSILSVMIAGCLTVGAVNVAAAAAPPMGDQAAMDSQQPVSDTWITTKVKSELAITDHVDALDVSVDTVNGVVHLTGNVQSDTERNKAIAAAKSVKGVKKVDASGLKASAMTAPSGDATATDSDHPVSDTWITTKVKSELATTNHALGMDVSVKTVNSVVHLSGSVTSDVQRKSAIAAAKSVKGVTMVDANALIISPAK